MKDKTTMAPYIYELDAIFEKYLIKDNKNVLGYRNNFIDFVKGLENKNLSCEYKKQGLFYEIVNLQNKVGLEIDLLNYYTMVIAQSNRHLGQDFTPTSLSKLQAEMIVDNGDGVFYDCAGGTGSELLMAYYKWAKKQKHFDDQFNSILEIDEMDEYNCYCCVFNFISRGLNAIVRHKNTLANDTYKIFIMTNIATNNEIFSWYSDYKTITNKEEFKEWE